MREINTRPLVLLVEDYEDTREMYRDYLEFSGFSVATARDGMEAIEKATAMRPDVILMDLSLPIMDGWEATRRLKSAPDTAALKIIALSAYPPATDGMRVQESGCDGFIAKPCLPTDLVEQLSLFLSLAPATPASVRRSRRSRV
jgi:two-component system, cell cycle response regulator DivK